MESLLYLLIGFLVGVVVVGAIAAVQLCEEQAKTRKLVELYNEQSSKLQKLKHDEFEV
jgi:gas vesicle protein